MFFIFLIGLADVYVAGRIGKEVQASYGFVSQLYFIFSIIAFALTTGAVSVIARLYTSGRKKDLNIAVDSSLISAAASGFVLWLLALVFSGPIINKFGLPEALKDFSVSLMQVYSYGVLFSYILLNTNGILRACGMIKKSLWTMALVCFLNVVLNFVLAFATPLGFRGIAFATVISTIVGCVLNVFFLRRVMTGELKFSMPITKKIIGIGWPAGLLQIFWQLAALALFLILSALPIYNVEILAAFTNGLKIESAIFLPAFAFNLAAAVVVGNSLGKQNKKDAFFGGIVTAFLGVIIISCLTLVVILNAYRIASLLSDNQIVINECARYIRIALIFEPIMAWSVILGGGLNGAGDTKGVMIIIALCVWLLRIPLSYIFGLYFGFGQIAVWWSMNASIFIQAIFITKRYFARRWLAHAHAELPV